MNGASTGAGGPTPSGTWNATNTNWSNGDGASPTVAWVAGNSATFSAGSSATGIFTVTVEGTQSISGITFEQGTVTLTGGTLDLSANATINTYASLTQTINSTITGSFSLTKSNAGTLVLGGTNTYSGGTTMTAGTLGIASDTALGTGTLTYTAGTIRAEGAARTLANNVTLNANFTTVEDAGLGFAGVISGAFGIVKNGNSTLTLGGANTYSAGTTLNAGAIAIAGNNALGTGILTAAGGSLQVNAGSHTLGNNVILNNSLVVNGSANLTLSGVISGVGTIEKWGTGTLVLSGNNTLSGNIAAHGGTILMTGGSASPNQLYAGTTFWQTGGSLTTSSADVQGLFKLSGGSNTIGGDLRVGPYNGGEVKLSGTGALTANNIILGNEGGMGWFTQCGGTASISSDLIIGYEATDYDYPGSSNTYTLSGGLLTVGGSVTVARYGRFAYWTPPPYPDYFPDVWTRATFSQTGGAHTIAGDLTIGRWGRTVGTYDLSGGSLVVSGDVFLSEPGTFGDAKGVLNVSGGEMTVAGSLNATNSYSQINLFNGGTINTAAINLYGSPSRFNWTGGTLHFTSDALLGSAVGSLNVGSNHTLTVAGDEALHLTLSQYAGGSHTVAGTVTLGSGGTLNGYGATFNYGAFVQSGGTFNGTFANLSGKTFTYNSGAFNAHMINNGTLALNSDFTIGNGIENNAPLSILTGRTVSLNGGTSLNSSTIDLAGGTLAGNSTLINNSVLKGYGSIGGSLELRNYGVFQLAGGHLAYGSTGYLHNYANIDLAAGQQLQMTAADLFNAGSIALNSGSLAASGTGTIVNSVNGVITGNGSITGSLTNAGTITLSSGSLLVSSFANSGQVSLSGNAANFGAGAIVTNSGTIEGYGRVSAAVTNTGTIEAAGGTLVLGGAVTNSAGGRIVANVGAKVQLAAAMAAPNAGTIALAGGTFDTATYGLTNSATAIVNGSGFLRTGQITYTPGPVPEGAGLYNYGAMNFSGTTQIFGDVWTEGGNSTDIIISGGSTLTFFDDVYMRDTVASTPKPEIRAGSGSRVVYFGLVKGDTNLTGTGVHSIEGTLSPGFSPGYLSASNLELGEAGTFSFDLAGTLRMSDDVEDTSGHYSAYDVGELTLNEGGTLKINLIDGHTPELGSTFTILTWTTLVGDPQRVNLDLVNAALAPALRWEALWGQASNGALVLSVQAVPETAGLTLPGVAAASLLRRRRQRSR